MQDFRFKIDIPYSSCPRIELQSFPNLKNTKRQKLKNLLCASISLPTCTRITKKNEKIGGEIVKNFFLMVYMLVLSRTVLVDKHCPTADPACVQWQLQLELSKVIFVVINTQLVLCYSLMTHVCVLAGRSSQCAAFRQCSV